MEKQPPQIVLLFSGKRKSGKDYICEKLKTSLGEDNCTILRISGPLKGLYAKTHNLDYQELLSDGPYKEKFRRDMIKWSDEIRQRDPGYFCRAACDEADLKPVWIITDVRRKSDIKWFLDMFKDKVRTIRVCADLTIRANRGWKFTPGVDDVESECGLDDFEKWDYSIKNNSTEESDGYLKELLLNINSIIDN